MSTSNPSRNPISETQPQGSTGGEPASATRVLAGTATVYLVPGRSDYLVRSVGDVEAVDVGADHAAALVAMYPTEQVPLSSTPAWPELSEREFVGRAAMTSESSKSCDGAAH